MKARAYEALMPSPLHESSYSILTSTVIPILQMRKPREVK